jgi:hypothetical protein
VTYWVSEAMGNKDYKDLLKRRRRLPNGRHSWHRTPRIWRGFSSRRDIRASDTAVTGEPQPGRAGPTLLSPYRQPIAITEVIESRTDIKVRPFMTVPRTAASGGGLMIVNAMGWSKSHGQETEAKIFAQRRQ